MSRLAVLSLLVAAACGGAVDRGAQFSSRSQDLNVANGDNLNGDNLNGDNLNGDNLNGDNLNGSSIGTHIVSVAYNGAAISGSQLVVGNRHGADVVGAQFTGTSNNGTQVPLQVAAVAQEPAPDSDTWEYSVIYKKDGNWYPLCGSGVPAFAIDGTWSFAAGVAGGGAKTSDGSSFTFACKGVGAIGKCVSPINYRPWRVQGTTSLEPYHEACVRMVRADFCGDGTSYTKDGNHINVYDAIGIQQDTETWLPEAEWDPSGARCVQSYNRSATLNETVACPGKISLVCGDPTAFARGALLVDEIPPPTP